MPITGNLKGKTCLVTGATSGIGRATVLRMAREEADIVILARDKKRGDAVAHHIYDTRPRVNAEVLVCDLASQSSVRKAAQEFVKSHDRLDILINAASVFTRKKQTTEDGFELMWATNHFGPFLLTNLLLPQLKKSPDGRVLTLAPPARSRVDFDALPDPKEFKPYSIFSQTKAAQILFALELARRHKESNLTSNVVHPGLTRSPALREVPAALRYPLLALGRSPKRAARVLVLLASSKPLGRYTGRFYRRFKPSKPPKFTREAAHQKRMWEISTRLTKLKA